MLVYKNNMRFFATMHGIMTSGGWPVAHFMQEPGNIVRLYRFNIGIFLQCFPTNETGITVLRAAKAARKAVFVFNLIFMLEFTSTSTLNTMKISN